MMDERVVHFNGRGVDSLGAFISDGHRDQLCAWVASLGEDPTLVLPQFRILRTDGRYQLHLSRKVRRDGHDVLDVALNRVWSEPVIVDLGSERCWPKWLHDTDEQPARVLDTPPDVNQA